MWRELYRALPDESLIYLGDGANCPYGSLSKERIRHLAEQSVEVLLARGCKMIVVACNTATAAAITHLRERFQDVPFVGLEPAVKPACKLSRSGIVGVVATERSLASEKFQRAVERYGEGVKIISAVGSGFVELVESGNEQGAQAEQRVSEVIEPLIKSGADVIVLGCTHYPFLKATIRKVVGQRDILIIDSGEAVEKRVESLLDRFDLRASEDNEPRYEFLTFADEAYSDRLRNKAFSQD